jgi:hypothetical protein
METAIIRKPRPMGLTQLSLEYQKTGNQEVLTQMYNYLVNNWYTNTGLICGTHYDINSFASKYQIPRTFISNFMMETVCGSRIWDEEKQKQLMEGLIGEQITWALEDRMEIINQVNILKTSQNGKYTPFITSELNKALKLRLDSSTSLQQLIRSMAGSSSSINIFNQFNQQQNNIEQSQYITVEEARDIIQQQNHLENKSEEAKYLETKYDLEALPEVVATKQQGVDTSKEGLTLNTTEINAITDNYKGAIEASSKEHHELRREIEQRIDPDEEDPELNIYEEIQEPQIEESRSFGSSPFLNN